MLPIVEYSDYFIEGYIGLDNPAAGRQLSAPMEMLHGIDAKFKIYV